MKHKSYVEGYENELAKLSDKLGDLRYDTLSNFLDLLSYKLEKDSIADKERGRHKLSAKLRQSSDYIRQASVEIKDAWIICEPFMDDYE